MDNGAVLSQDAIDALLNAAPAADGDAPATESQPADSADPSTGAAETVQVDSNTPETGGNSGAQALGVEVAPPPSDAQPSLSGSPAPQGNSPIPAAPVYQPLPPPPPMIPPPVVAQPGKGGITREEATEIAGEAAETESAPIQASVSRIAKRIDTLELALDQIAELEEEIVRLKKRPEPKPDPRVLKLFERLNALEERAKNSPVFGLYDKFNCTSCGHIGEAQVRARCGHCEKEGWFGRKSKKGSHPEHDANQGHPAEQPGATPPAQPAVEIEETLLALDPNLGI